MLYKDINKRYLWLLDIIKDITDEFILEPSIKINYGGIKHGQINTNRYSVLIPKYQDFLIILNRINGGTFFTDGIFKFIASGMLKDADCIIGIDNNNIKIYLDYGDKIDAMIIGVNNEISTKEYIVLQDKYKHLALKYSYLFSILDVPINIGNWRHVYQVTPTPTITTKNSAKLASCEYHISLIQPIVWHNYRIYLLGISELSLTLYHR